jgi:YidC/Oxa1 family membrane protein insertase
MDSLSLAEQARIEADSSSAILREDTDDQPIVTSDTADIRKRQNELGEFASSAFGENELYVIENELIKLTISSRGGRPYSVELKKYKTFSRQPVILFDGDSTRFGLSFYYQNKPVSTNDLYFIPADTFPHNATVNPDSLTMRLEVNEKKYIEYRYKLSPGSYMVDLSLQLTGMKDIVTRDPSSLDLNWEANIPQHEQLKKNEQQYTSLYFRHFNEDVDYFRLAQLTAKEDIPTQEWPP